MIETTIGHINEAIPFFQKLISMRLSAPLAFRVARLSGELQQECDKINEVRLKLMDKYFVKNGNDFVIDENTGYKIIEGKELEYQKEIEGFLNEKIMLKSEKLPSSILDSCDDVSPVELIRLMDFFEE